MSQQSYSMDEVIVTVGGVKCEGYSEESLITVSHSGDGVPISRDICGTPINKYLDRVDPVPFSADTPEELFSYLGGYIDSNK